MHPKTIRSSAKKIRRFATLHRVLHGSALLIAFLAIGTASMSVRIFTAQATAGQILKVVTSDGGGTFYVGRCFRTDFRVQTDSLDANSVDIILPYNPTYLQPYTGSGCAVAATAILTDGLFLSHPSNTISGNQIQVTAYDPTGTNPVNTGAAPTDKLLGHIYWKVMAASGAYNMNFDFTPGSTIDTNMAQQNGNGTDVLDSVQNLTLNLSSDAANPTFTSLSPASAATNVSVTTGISYTFSDAGAGVNTGSLTTKLSGTTKTLSYSGCSRTNSNRVASCNVTVNSVGTLSYATTYTVAATGSDIASPTPHAASQAWNFTTEDDTAAPYVQNLSPTSGQTGVAVNSNIVMHIKDYKGNAGVTPGLGVAISTVQVTLTPAGGSPIVYTYASPQFSYSGTSADYTITINPTADFNQNTVVSVSVEASDQHAPANVMTTYAYSFTTTDSTAPTFGSFSPAQSATGVAPDSNVVFHILDAGAGVNINNTTVVVAGISYTSASPQFTYTGTSSNYTITINPTANFSGGQVVTVSITTYDLASSPNIATTSYTFTANNVCTTCSVDTEDPARFTLAATLDNTISFHVKDTGVGISQGSIRMTLIGTGSAMTSSPLVLTGSSLLVSITGSASNYTVTITLPASISQNIPYSLMISATDTDSVPMTTVGYTFMNLSAGSSSSSSSSSSACPVCTTTTCSAATTETEHTGGGNRNVTSILRTITTENLPTIIWRRHLPNSDVIIQEQLTAEEARKVDRCYIDGDLHLAAPKTAFNDVPAGAWYEAAVQRFVANGVLDATQQFFRGDASAVRAEFAKILAKVHGGTVTALPARMTFDDVPRNEWYAQFIEFAANKNWMRGYQNCIGTHPCKVVPGSTITRAEAIAMVVRFHGLKPLSVAPLFRDVSADAWYAKEMAIAADHCIAQPASASYSARPSELLTRAQMVVLLDRASKPLVYGQDCTWPSTDRSSSSSKQSIRSSQSSVLSSSSLSSVSQSSVPHSALTSSHASSVSARSESSSEQKALSGSTMLRPAAPSQNAMLPIVTMAFIGMLGLGVAARLFFKAELSAL